MKYFFLSLAVILLLSAGIFAVSLTKTNISIPLAKDCSMGEIKQCYSGINNRCCPPKYAPEKYNEEQLAKGCSMGEIKLCYSGVQNKCCPPKVMERYFETER